MSQYIANKIVSSCSLTDEQAKKVLATYCKELGNAPDSAFYEGCMYIKLPGVYESGGGVIYVPKSFTETRNIMKSYFDSESDN